MPVTAMTSIRICHALERFYFRIDMFYHNSPPRKRFIICLLLFGQLMAFTRFYRNEAVRMVFFYPKIAKICVKRYRIADAFSYGVFIYLEIMFTAFGFLYINDFMTVPLNYDLALQRVPLFFPE
jgi:hypothetical protein